MTHGIDLDASSPFNLEHWHHVKEGEVELDQVPVLDGAIQVENYAEGMDTTKLIVLKAAQSIRIAREDKEPIQITDHLGGRQGRNIFRVPVEAVSLTTADPTQKLWTPKQSNTNILYAMGFQRFVDLVGSTIVRHQIREIIGE